MKINYNIINKWSVCHPGNHRNMMCGYPNPLFQNNMGKFAIARLQGEGFKPEQFKEMGIIGVDNSSTSIAGGFIRMCHKHLGVMPSFLSGRRCEEGEYWDGITSAETYKSHNAIIFCDDDIVSGRSLLPAIQTALNLKVPLYAFCVKAWLVGTNNGLIHEALNLPNFKIFAASDLIGWGPIKDKYGLKVLERNTIDLECLRALAETEGVDV